MKSTTSIRSLLVVAALAALAGCGSQIAGHASPAEARSQGAPPTVAAAGAPGAAPSTGPGVVRTGDDGAVEVAFRGYYQALLDRDFAAACSLSAPETVETLLATLKNHGTAVGTCQEALTTIYAIPGAADAADGISRTIEINGVAVTGDTATITWSAQVQASRRTVTNGLRRLDGRWLLVDTD